MLSCKERLPTGHGGQGFEGISMPPSAIKLAGISVRRVRAVSLGHYQAKVRRLVSGPGQDCAGQGEVLGKP